MTASQPSRARSRTTFRRISSYVLAGMTCEQLLRYRAHAEAASDHRAVKTADQILAWVNRPLVIKTVRSKVPESHVEDVAGNVMEAVCAGRFRGRTPGQFRSYMKTIARNKVCDFHRGRQRCPEVSLDQRVENGREPAADTLEDLANSLTDRAAVKQALSTLNDTHRRVMELWVEDRRLTGAEVAAQVEGISADNAFQIKRRFKLALEPILERGHADAE